MLISTAVGTVASVRGCAASRLGRRKAARRRGWGGRRWWEAARACMRKGARAQERSDARSTGRKDTTEGGALARRGGTPASSAQSRTRKEKGSGSIVDTERRRVGSSVRGKRVRMRGYNGVWKGAKVRATEREAHTDVKTAAAARTAARHGARTKRYRALRKGRRADCARGGVGSGTCKRLLPSLARRSASHSTTAWQRHGKALSDDRDIGSKARRYRG
jgi:hypothetical protein